MKRLFLSLALILMALPAMAWNLPGKPFGIDIPKIASGDVPIAGEDVLATMPLVDTQYSFATKAEPESWNVGVFQAFGIFNLKPDVGSNIKVSSILFIGVGLNTNVSSLINSQFNAPVIVDWGLELGIPAAQGIPQLTVGIQGRFDQPDRTITFGGAVPLESIADYMIQVFGKI